MSFAKLLFNIVLLPLSVLGQSVDDLVVYDQKILDRFYKSTTYVVLDQHTESAFSLALSESIKEFWKITPFEIIDRATYDTYSKDKTKSFLTREHIAGDENLISLSLFMGGQKQMDVKGQLISNVKLKHYTATDEDFLYKLPVLIKNIQWKVNMIRNLKFADDLAFKKYYEDHIETLHGKKLYILNEFLTPKVQSLEELKKYYRHDVSLVTKEVLIDAIQTEDSTIAFLSIVAPVKNWGGQTAYYRIFSTDTGESLVSYERSVSSTAPVGVIGNDLKNFNK